MREMKDSGIEWIGEIPKEWEIVPIKYVKEDSLNSFVDGPFGSNLKSCHYVDDGDVYVIESGFISTGKFIFKDFKTITFEHFSTIKRSECKNNDVIIAKIGANYGMAGILPALDKPSVVSGNSLKLTLDANKMDNMLFVWQMEMSKKNGGFVSVVNETAQPALSLGILNNYRIIMPSPKEQKIIVDYLKEKLFEIDATGEDIQKEISLLEEYKKSLIYNAISNGINHSAYSNETDEVWGNVPQGWKLVDIKYLFEIVKRIAGKEGYDVLSVTQNGLKVKDITSGDGQLADNYSGYQFVYPTDYVMNHMDLLTGWVDCSELFGVTSPDYRVFRLMDKAANNLVYYKYVMQCCYMNKIFYSLGQGVSNLGRWRLQTSSFNNFKVPVPPKAEQDEIADYLDSKCSEIDTLIADKKRQLDILADYKKSLIYEYVTGKKEVPVKDF
jgi:restriction modification system DNA specificity domain protein